MSFHQVSRRPQRRVRAVMWLFVACAASLSCLHADDAARIYATPQQAVSALNAAVNSTNQAAFELLFGPAARDLANPDPVQAAQELAEFASAFNTTNRLVRDSETRMVLEVGSDFWPFPVPLIKVGGGWQFDAAAGLEEIQNRRIGRNEMDVLRVLRAYVQAQREYASRDRDGDDVLEYAQKISSSPGLTDGLYWPPESNGETSPLGPFVAYAQAEGYPQKKGNAEEGPRPFHGYFFKILVRQGKNAPGGKYDYIINGNMIGGFAMAAWPAEYGETGVMTLIVNQQGRVYQKDLGPKTARIAHKMDCYDPDKSWRPSAD
jgi:hypothetical protein